jgi:hypothetical protein
MFLKKSLPLRNGEIIIEIVKPTVIHSYFSVILGLVLILADAFMTFWFLQKGVEGKVFYGIVMALGLYLVLYGSILKRSNFLIITNERIFDVQKESLFSETLSALNLIDLADVVVERKGVWSVVLNYGVITIHPKDGKFKFEIERVPKPSRIQNLLFERRDHANRSNQYLNNASLLKQVLKAIPDFSEAELTMLYERVNSRLSEISEIEQESSIYE